MRPTLFAPLPERRGRYNTLIPCRGDLVFEHLRAERADDHGLADHVAGRAVDGERLGQARRLVDRLGDFLARYVAVEARHVERDRFGGGERARLVVVAAVLQELAVELEIAGAARV